MMYSHIKNKIRETKYFRSLGTLTGRFLFILVLLLILSLTCKLNLSAQNLGITTPGSTSYPQTNIGNTLTQTGNCAGNYLTVNQFTTTVPLTAISIRTFGTVSSGSNNVKVSIYSDNGTNSPGTLLFTEVSSTVTANTTSTITIPNTYLSAGKYWIAYNMNSSSASANFITKSTGVTGAVRKFQTMTFSTSFPANPSSGSWTDAAAGVQDDIYFVGVPIQGYAKATKTSLLTNGIFSSMSFYSHVAGNARLAIFSDNGSGTAPSAKQWESGDLAVSASAWKTVNISSGTPTSLNLTAGTYWLAWQWNSAANGPSYSTGSANTGNAIVQAYGAYPSGWTGGTASAENWSIYATYSACTPPSAPTVTSPVPYCINSTASPLTATGTNLLWYTTAAGGTGSSTAPTPSTAIAGTTSYYVSQNTGCEGPRAQIDVVVHSLPTASATKTDISCFNTNTGQIIVTGSGGTIPYTYNHSINNGSNGGTYQPGSTFTGLAKGEYKIRVKDMNTQCESIKIP